MPASYTERGQRISSWLVVKTYI